MTTDTTLTGKALVVGANGGKGRAIATALADAGVDCALVGRNRGAIDAVTEQFRAAGARAENVYCDIANIGSIEAAVGEAIDRIGAGDSSNPH